MRLTASLVDGASKPEISGPRSKSRSETAADYSKIPAPAYKKGELVATRDDLEATIRDAAGADEPAPALLSGWRRELAGDALLRLLHGEVTLRVVPGPPHVEERPATP